LSIRLALCDRKRERERVGIGGELIGIRLNRDLHILRVGEVAISNDKRDKVNAGVSADGRPVECGPAGGIVVEDSTGGRIDHRE
jgi:hypothetical protein